MDARQPETHHAMPRCLLKLHERARGNLRAAGVGAWLEFELEARRWGVPVEIDRDDLERLVESSSEVLDKERHRLLHSSDWQRWGRRGGLATLGRYGSEWFALLALRRWGRISQRVASILTCPQDDATSADQRSRSSRPLMLHDAMWVTFTETRCHRRISKPRGPCDDRR